MKKRCLATVFLFFLSACARAQTAQMTPQEQEAAKEEIGETVDGTMQSLEELVAVLDSVADRSKG